MHKKSVDPENEEPQFTEGRDNQTAMGRAYHPWLIREMAPPSDTDREKREERTSRGENLETSDDGTRDLETRPSAGDQHLAEIRCL